MRTVPRRYAWILVVSMVVAGMAATSAPAAAGALDPPPDPTQSGKVGPHHLADSETTPGATCRYGTTFDFVRWMEVAPPVVLARAPRRSQRVASRVTIQYWTGMDWALFKRTAFQFRTATPTTPAPFTSRRVTVDALHDFRPFYRARVDMRWYARDGLSVLGKASMWVDFYRMVWPPGPDAVIPSWCQGTAG